MSAADGLHYECVLNAQQLQLVPQETLSAYIGELHLNKLLAVRKAVKEAIGC